MTATEIIARLIDSKAINGEEATCLFKAMVPLIVYSEPYKPPFKDYSGDLWWMNPLNRPTSALANPKSTSCEGVNSAASTISLNENKEQFIIDVWMARDRNDSLYLYVDRPCKNDCEWNSSNEAFNIDNDLFLEIKWQDKEPTRVKIIIEKV